jgi:hypothetical protein
MRNRDERQVEAFSQVRPDLAEERTGFTDEAPEYAARLVAIQQCLSLYLAIQFTMHASGEATIYLRNKHCLSVLKWRLARVIVMKAKTAPASRITYQ